MSLERLWFCHGALMLERYLAGGYIEGMLRHNVFMAEKSSSRVYMPQAIVKYDEAVRDKARAEGSLAYTGGDMSLAMRFLSTEFTKPKPGAFGNNFGPRNLKKQPVSQSLANVNGRPSRLVCWQFNSGGCMFESCKYPHICSRCFMVGHSQHTCKVSIGGNQYSGQANA